MQGDSALQNQINDVDQEIAIVIPAYNEQRSIRQVVEQSLSFLPNVIVVDDGSKDNTITQLEGLPIILLQNKENCGKATCLLQGFFFFLKQGCAAVICLDADTQHDPVDIPRFLKAHHAHPNDIILGSRLYNREFAPRARLFANKLADFFISWAAGSSIVDTQSGYRLYPKALMQDCLNLYSGKAGFVFESEVLIDGVRGGFSVKSIGINSKYPANARKSHYKPTPDSIKIGLMIARKLILRGMCLPSLFRALHHPFSLLDF